MRMPVVDPVATGKKIDALRKSAGMSVAEVAEEFGLSTTYAVYKWLNGKSMPTIDNLLGLSLMFGVPMEGIVAYH